MRGRAAARPPRRCPAPTTRERVALLVGTPMAEVERELIEATIEHCEGSIPRAAKLLALSPSTDLPQARGLVRRPAPLRDLTAPLAKLSGRRP